MNKHYEISPKEAAAELANRELARRHLLDFNKYVYEGYKTSWHIEFLCNALEKVITGEIRFLIVEMPPRHSKSLNVSQLFPAFVVGNDKDAPIIVTSYSGDLAVDHGRETRNLIDSKLYKNVFDTKLAADSTAKGRWNTDGRGAYNAVGVGGSITGKGAKYFIADDLFKDRMEADSEIIRESRWKWLRSVARTRLTPDGRMIVMGTRWHEDDVIGRLTDGEKTKEDWVDYFDFLKGKRAKWVRLTLPAIAEIDEPHRKAGEVLWPGQYPITELRDIEKTLGPYEFSALYQQKPVNDATREFKTQWYKHIDESVVELMNCRRFLTVDTAMSKLSQADYTGFCDNRVNQENFWHFIAWRMKFGPEELVDALFTLHNRNRYEKIGIEKTTYTVGLKPYIDQEQRKRNVFLPIVELEHHQMSKVIRIRGLIPRYASGSIFHIKGKCDDLEKEQSSFPVGAHDDTLDAVAYMEQMEIKPPERKLKTKTTPVKRGDGLHGI